VVACATARNGLSLAARQRDRVVEDAFFRAAASLETFLTEWLVRCLSIDASVFRATYESRASNWAKDRLERECEPSERFCKRRKRKAAIRVDLPILKTHSLEDTRACLDAIDDNVSIRGTTDLVVAARDYLVAPCAKPPQNLGAQRAAVLDATVAVRNVLAHRSPLAGTRMNECLRSSKMPVALRRERHDVRAAGVGYYLQAKAGGRCRFERYSSYWRRLGMAWRLREGVGV
jgi:hypothetical protein